MVEQFSLGYKLTAAAGASGTTTLHTVSSGVLHITYVRLYFPTGSEGCLQVNLRKGMVNIYPVEGYASGDDTTWEFRTEQILSSGEELSVFYNNTDTTNSHDCYILVEGYVER